MRVLAILLPLVLLAPAALASDLSEGVHVEAGPCYASVTNGVDNSFVTAGCAPVVHVRAGSGVAGFQCEVRVLFHAVSCWP